MKISIITVFPDIYESFLKLSLIGRAIEKKIIDVKLIRFSDMCEPKVRIDNPACGPGAGMVIKPEVIQKAIQKSEREWGKGFKIFFSPQGERLEQPLLKKLAQKFFLKESSQRVETKEDHIILVCARYEGIDQRVEDFYADLILSIGDYVVMGGDLPAQVFLESFLRLVPGVVGKFESVEKESFSGPFLDYPTYSLPKEWNGLKVPEILLSGNHAEIEKFRKKQAAKKTVLNRFDWFRSSNPKKEEIELAKEFIPNHYVALMHTQVLVQDNKEGNTSITSLDIHDIARSSATYGIKNYFVVSQLKDQQNILKSFMEFWLSDEGKEYNLSRFEAVKRIIPAFNFEDVFNKIKEKEGVEPIIITTSAKADNSKNIRPKIIDYSCQKEIFKKKRPVLFLFGTGKGLSYSILEKSDYLLLPVNGMTNYNHLSVRSAVAIILDRWLGLFNKL
ncbi:tRNA (guanosine(37)-N1)-methyltransferase TrmD [Candidatus Dependentiae bacterium]|nr:tRNA (guanosine(37)-N1)-methyltransferase TrmD [Candidatus Dependentiae bacterium]